MNILTASMMAFYTTAILIQPERANSVNCRAASAWQVCGIGMADGSSLMPKWVTTVTLAPVHYGPVNDIAVVNNQDLAWLAKATPRPNF